MDLLMLTLSQINGWDVTHLEDAAAQWNKVADIWEDAYYNVRVEVMTPGDTEWMSAAADEAQAHADHEYRRVVNVADALRAKAVAATNGARDLASAKTAVLAEVNAATADGFSVEEDLSVHDTALATMMLPDRQALARAHQGAITAKAGELAALDKAVAAQLTPNVGGLDFTPDDSTPLPPLDAAALPQEYVKTWFDEHLNLNHGGGGSVTADNPPPPIPGPLDKLLTAQNCDSRELRDAWLGYISATGGTTVGLVGAAAGGPPVAVGLALAGGTFQGLQIPGAWDTLMDCYGIK